MDEICGENDFTYFSDYEQDCVKPTPALTFFLLLSMVPMSFLMAMILVSQHLYATGDITVDEEEEEELYENKYPIIKNRNTNKVPNTKLLSILEYTPQGNVFMKYDLENESFDYWADYKEIPFNYLETVARKYVNTFCCVDLYVKEESDEEYSDDFETEEENSDSDEEETSEEETTSEEESSEQETPEQEESQEQEKEDSDDEGVFAKLKTAETIKETVEEESKLVNKFRYKGKLADIMEFKQPKKQKNEPKNVSFSSWKGLF